jgi:hypothetical protein
LDVSRFGALPLAAQALPSFALQSRPGELAARWSGC